MSNNNDQNCNEVQQIQIETNPYKYIQDIILKSQSQQKNYQKQLDKQLKEKEQMLLHVKEQNPNDPSIEILQQQVDQFMAYKESILSQAEKILKQIRQYDINIEQLSEHDTASI